MTWRLENTRDTTAPKCANCSWWAGCEGPAGQCGQHEIKTLDLAVCTGWRGHNLPEGDLIVTEDE